MFSVICNELAHNRSLSVKKTTFEMKILEFKIRYPSARLVHNYGHTFLLDETKFVFIAFKGTKSLKPTVTVSFQNLNCLIDYYHSYVNKVLKAMVATRLHRMRAGKKNEREIQPGAIFYTSSGCDQIKIEFFQIIEVKGRSVTIQKIQQVKSYSSVDHGITRGVKDSFIEPPVKLRLGPHGIRIDAVRYLNYWNRRGLYWCSCA